MPVLSRTWGISNERRVAMMTHNERRRDLERGWKCGIGGKEDTLIAITDP